MIEKKEFVMYIKLIENFRSKQQITNAMIHKVLEMNGHSVLGFGDDMVQCVIELLSINLYWNAKEYIEWFLYEKTFSETKPKKYDIEDKTTGKKYFINSPEDLYDMLIDFKMNL